MIRAMARTDLPIVVEIHLRSFQGFFLSFLGKRFLYELYSALLQDPQAISLVAEQAGRVQGFVVGVEDQRGFFRRLVKRRWWRFGIAALPRVVRSPGTLPRLLRAFRKSDEAHEAAAPGLLMSIAVEPASQGRSLGKAMVHEFLQQMAARGAIAVSLTTDRDGNDAVNAFYRRLGFTVARERMTPEGRHLNEYVIALSSDR